MRRAALPAFWLALAVGALAAGGAVGASLAATGTTRAAFTSSVDVPFGPVGAAAAEATAPTESPTTPPTPTLTPTATPTTTPTTTAPRKHHAAEPEPSGPTTGPAATTAPAPQTAGAAAPPGEAAPAEVTAPTTPEATPTPS